jgi:alpha-1,3-rhamnosyl/mannosyltransferase
VPGFEWVLHVVGAGGALSAELSGLARSLGVGSLVAVQPFLPQEKFQALFASCRLVLFPTSEEGFGLPIIEAMRLGIPVVTSDVIATREIGGEAALYAPPDDVDTLAERCIEVVTDPWTREERAAAGREWSSRFSWRRTGELTRAALELRETGLLRAA